MGAAQRGVNRQTTGKHFFTGHAQKGLRFVQHRIGVPAVGNLLWQHLRQHQRFCRRFVPGLLVDHAFFQHDVENIVSSGTVVLGADVGRVIAGSLDAGRQRAGLRQGQIPRVHAEISLSRRLNAVGTVAEIDVVQIHGQNVVLAHAAFQLPCQPDFLGLSGKGLLRAQMALTDQLHGDGAGPLRVAAFPDVGRQRAEEPHHVHAVVTVKAQVFRRQKYVPRLLWNIVKGDHYPVLAAFDGHDELAFAVVHAARLGRGGDAAHVQRLPVGHVQHKEPRRSSGYAQHQQHHQRRPQRMTPGRQPSLITARGA